MHRALAPRVIDPFLPIVGMLGLMMNLNRALGALTLCGALAACGPSSSTAADAGEKPTDAGPQDAGWTTHSIYSADFLCVCPGQTAAELSSASAGSDTVEWAAQFASPTTIGPQDQLTLDIDFAGPVTGWTIGLEDTSGHVGFPTAGEKTSAFDPTNWNCIHAVYTFSTESYVVYVNSTGGATEMMALPMTVAGVDIQFNGSAASMAWIDSIVVTHTDNTGTATILYQQSFDDPSSAGTIAGNGVVATPPSSIMVPAICNGMEQG